MRRTIISSLTFFVLCAFPLVVLSFSSGSTPFPNDTHTKKIFEQERLIKDGNDLVEQGRYDEAIAKYQEAMKPELLLHDYDIGPPIFLMSKALKFQGKYEEALHQINEVLKKHPDVHEGNWHDQKLELEALIKSRDTGLPEPVYEHIKYLREKYKNQLPPVGYSGYSGYSINIISPLIRLYDHIGDYDGGIAFIDELIAYYSNQKHGFDPKKRKYDADVLKIREAFEQDKAEGKKGRATRALIQSDYFPW